MGIIANALGEGLGSSLQMYAQGMARAEESENRLKIERERLKQERELRLAEIASRGAIADTRAAAAGAGRGSRGDSIDGVTAEMYRDDPGKFGIKDLPSKDRYNEDTFTRSAPEGTDGTGNMTDAVSRKAMKLEKTGTKFDSEGYERDSKGIIEGNLRATGMIGLDYDKQTKAKQVEMINDALAKIATEPDPKRRDEMTKELNAMTLAAEGKDRFGISGNTGIDKATGAQKTTEVGESMVTKNERPPATKGGSAKGLTSEKLTTQLAEYRRQLKDAREGKQTPESKERIRILDEAIGEIIEEQSQRRRGGPASSEAPAPAPAAATKGDTVAKPTSRAEFDKLPKGARYINPADGKTYIKK